MGNGSTLRSLTTTLIVAAGKGSRLGYHLPKVLYPIRQKPILHWIIDRFVAFSGNFIVVCSPEGQASIEYAVNEGMRSDAARIRTAIQDRPLGMAHAIRSGLADVRTPWTAIVWGDQVGIQHKTLEQCFTEAENQVADLVFPIVKTSPPYIHFELDPKSMKVLQVFQAREGDEMPEHGISDIGFFLCRTTALQETFKKFDPEHYRGKNTGEFNFLPMLRDWSNLGFKIKAMHGANPEEAIGINSLNDVERVERWLI